MTDRFNHLVKINGRSISENFSYDNHNQLTAVYKNGAYPRYYQYDGISNMQSKNDAGIFKYENPSPYQPSEMNLLPDAPSDLLQTHKVSYNSFNKVDTLISDEYRLEIAYGLGSQRIKQKLYSIENNRNQLIKEKKFISANTEIIIFEQKTDTITYITSPEGLTAIVVASSNTAGREWYWVFTDHLGSITTLVRNSDGQKVEMSYDAWGNRRDPATWENYNGTLPSFITDRGYTGHEHLDEFTLINMNGRMYDPQTARFLSPDVVVSDPSNPSSFNPYAYVLNNPLRYTDPSGYEPFTIAATVIAAFILYGSHAKQNADPATGKWDWNITNWFGKDKPGLMLGITNTSFKSFFSNTTFFVSMDNTNGSGITLGYHTKYHFGGGSSPQNLYFPNDNTAAAEAAAVNSIARGTGNYSKITAAIDNYMDILTANVMRSYCGTWLPGIEVVWNGKYGSGSVVGGVPEWWSGGTAAGQGGNWFSDAYNSAIGRMMVPDFLAIGVGFNGIVGVGGATSIEFRWVTHGPEASWKPMITVTQSVGGGFSVDATLNLEAANYIGNVNNIRRRMMITSTPNGDIPTFWGSGGVAAGGKIGVTGYVTPNVGGSFIIGRELNVGAGLPAGPLPTNGAGGVSNTWILYDFYK